MFLSLAVCCVKGPRPTYQGLEYGYNIPGGCFEVKARIPRGQGIFILVILILYIDKFFNGTVSVILSDPPGLHAKIEMFD